MFFHIRKIARGWFVYSSPTAQIGNLTFVNCFGTRKQAQALVEQLSGGSK